MKIRGISGIAKLADVKVPLTHPATGEVFGHLFGNVKNFELHRAAFFVSAKELVGEALYKAFLRKFCTGWDFVGDETGEPLAFNVDAVCELSSGTGLTWVGIPFFEHMMDAKNFYCKPSKA